MALGKWLTRGAPVEQHSRMVVSDGFRIGPSATLGANEGWGWEGFVHALGIPGVERAVSLISDVVGGLPFDAYTEHGRNFAEKISPRPVLLDQPNPEEVRASTFAAWVADYLLHGNALGVIVERNRQGVPTALVPVPAWLASIRRSAGETYAVMPAGMIEYDIGGKTYGAHDVFHVKALSHSGWPRGYGVIQKHLWRHNGSLRLAEELQRQAHSIENNGVPTGVLKATNPDVTKDDLIAAKDGWMRSQRDRTVAALGPGTDFIPLAWNPEELQLIEARKFSLLEVANIFGLPPRFLGASSGDSMTYSTSETESIDLIKFSLGGIISRFEQTLSLLYPHGTEVKANLDALLRADTTARYNAHQVGIQAGFLLRSEARSIEDLPPVKGIDDQPETTAVQLKLNKEAPVTDPAILQPHAPNAPITGKGGGTNGNVPAQAK